jgi:small nuclear ribonucleoprotein (snRNP)-like protein
MLGGGVLACVCVALGAFLGSRNAGSSDPVSYGTVSPQSGNAIVNAVRNVGPSVMNVDTEFGRAGGTSEFLPNPSESTQPQRGKGTGVVIDSKRGLMLTNAHVVADAKKIQVTTRDGDTYSGQLIGSDRLSDIAVVKLSNRTLPQARLAQIKDPDHDLAIGDREDKQTKGKQEKDVLARVFGEQHEKNPRPRDSTRIQQQGRYDRPIAPVSQPRHCQISRDAQNFFHKGLRRVGLSLGGHSSMNSSAPYPRAAARNWRAALLFHWRHDLS